MPLHIIRQDITKIKCDAIVNAANNSLLGGGGVDGAIHRAAGTELLQECKTLGGCETGDAKITKGYNLPSDYVIHTVGPIWTGGKNGEKKLLESCYKRSLAIAKKRGFKSIAFPLISSGVYGYPKDKALRVATKTISKFLLTSEMTVYLCVFDRASFEISKKLFVDVLEYVSNNYATKLAKIDSGRKRSGRFLDKEDSEGEEIYYCLPSSAWDDDEISLEKMLADMDDSFSLSLLKLIDIKKISEVECYKKANVSKQTWYKIMNDKNYKPSKNTVLCFAFALELSLDETLALLKTMGFTLSSSSKFDVIIEYFLLKGVHDVFIINETLFMFNQPCLGVNL